MPDSSEAKMNWAIIYLLKQAEDWSLTKDLPPPKPPHRLPSELKEMMVKSPTAPITLSPLTKVDAKTPFPTQTIPALAEAAEMSEIRAMRTVRSRRLAQMMGGLGVGYVTLLLLNKALSSKKENKKVASLA